MPQTKTQELLFTLLMVPVMVIVMVLYNNLLAMSGFNGIVWKQVLQEIVLLCLLAAVVEFPLIAPCAHKMAFSLINPKTCPPFLVPVAISFCTVCLMCPFMSFMVTTFLHGAGWHFLRPWLGAMAVNFPVALLWQLCVAGPCVRKTFGFLLRQPLFAALAPKRF